MDLIGFLQSLAHKIPPTTVMSLGFIVMAILAGAIGFFRVRKNLWAFLPLLILTVLFALCFYPLSPLEVEPEQNHFIWHDWPPTGVEIALLVLTVIALVAYGFSMRRIERLGETIPSVSIKGDEEKRPLNPALSDKGRGIQNSRSLRFLIYPLCCLGIMIFFLFYHLRDYSGDLHTWETTGVLGFSEAFYRGDSLLKYASKCLFWDNGILSRGDTSLFFGLLTYALFGVAGFSILILRLVAALLAIGTSLLFFLFAVRFFGRTKGLMMGCFLTLNTALLFYGRYGSSPTGMLLSLVIVLYLTWKILEKGKPTLWLGIAWVLALYMATLQYAPVRVFVLYDIAFVMCYFLLVRRNLRGKHFAIIAFMLGLMTVITLIQYKSGVFKYLLFARGEQFFHFNTPGWVKRYLGLEVTVEEMTLGIRLQLALKMMSITFKELLGVVLPTNFRPRFKVAYMETGLPPLYFAPLGLFIIVGFFRSLVQYRKKQHLFLLIWLYYCTIPLLLTNRVDSHRLVCFVVLFSIWGGLGLWQCSEMLRRLSVPKVLRHGAAVFIIICVVYGNFSILYFIEKPVRTNREALQAAIEHVDGPLLVGTGVDIRERGAILLDLLERTRLSKSNEAYMMVNSTMLNLLDEANEESRTVTLKGIVNNSTTPDRVVLVPENRFSKTKKLLIEQSLKIEEFGLPPNKVMVVRIR